MLKKYFQFRRDVGDDGFWTDPQNSGDSQLSYKSLNKQVDNRIEKLEEIKKKVSVCTKCPLGKYRLNPCLGNGDPDSKIVFIGEGPGYDEDHTGNVFVGRAGKLLDRILEEAFNLKRSKVYITNIVKCHPMKEPEKPQKRGNDRPPNDLEVQTCINLYLIPQINLIKPKVIVTLGSPATKTILNTDRGITSLRGKIFDIKFGEIDAKVVPTYHPAYLLRNPPKKKEVLEDTKVIRSLL